MIKIVVSIIMLTFMLMLILLYSQAQSVFAQPPLPSPPSQAPIDGGLALLAAAGGAYAYKKLRGKSE